MIFIITYAIIGIVFVYKVIDFQANIDEKDSDWQ